MKNLVLIAVTVVGLSAMSFAQTEPTKPKITKTPQPLKTEKGITKKKNTPVKKEKVAPVKKEN